MNSVYRGRDVPDHAEVSVLQMVMDRPQMTVRMISCVRSYSTVGNGLVLRERRSLAFKSGIVLSGVHETYRHVLFQISVTVSETTVFISEQHVAVFEIMCFWDWFWCKTRISFEDSVTGSFGGA